MGHDTLCIDDGFIRHTYFPKPRAKAYLDNFAQEEEDDWLSCFEVGRDEDGNPKYGPVAPSFLDFEDDMERALAMEAYFNPFKNIIVFKKLIDFLGDEAWHVKFEVTTPSGQKFTRMFKTKKTNRKLSGKFILEDILKQGQPTCWAAQPHDWQSDETPAARLEATQGSYPNPLIANFEKKNKQGTIEYHLQQVKNANLKWREFPSAERHAYCERLSRLQDKGFGIPRVPSWTLFYDYNIEEILKNTMKYEYLHDDGDVFVDYSWNRALSIYGDVYPEWLCGVEKMLILPEFAVLLGLYEEYELNHGLFAIHFTKLEVDDKLFNHEAFWQKIGKPTSTNPRTSLIKEPLMRIIHKLLVGSLVYRAEEVAKCSEPIEYETWTVKMLANELDEGTHTLIQTEQEASQPGQARRDRQEPRGLDSSWGDWNASLNEIECRDVWRDLMLMRNNYIAPILHYLADQSNFAYPAYEPPNVPPYPYPYVPYPHPYTYYPDTGSPSFGGDHYGAHGDGYHACSIVHSSGYEIGRSSARFHGEDFDLIMHSKDYVESNDDEMQD
ncbi:hypothetical protein Tco_0970107 [Tanacetum coccineum]